MASVVISGDTSGAVTITAPAVAGTPTLTLPTTTDTLVGKATTDTLTNKTLVAPALGTPSALVLTNATGLPQAGLGTNVAGNGPAFGVYGATGTSLINNTDTKITYDTEEFDTNNNFASSRFTPTVAGYYQLSACLLLNVSSGVLGIILFKNGSRFKYGVQILNNTGYVGAVLSTLVYANGSTDYFEIFGITSGGTATNLGGQTFNYFNGSLVRAA